ncbi:MAG: MFS transporter [Syntrophaceae bacterium]|nr:MFS transporter [Syntrophaceae bacterium]
MKRLLERSPFFYGWIIVGSTVVSMILIYGIRHSFSVFFAPILDEFGWSRANIAIMFSLNIFVYGLLSPAAGTLANQWKPGRIRFFGITILGLATAGCAFVRELWHFYVLFGLLMPLGSAFCGWPILAPTLMNWFVRRRGLVMGLGQMGGGLSFVYSIFVQYTILQWGWRNAYLVLTAVLIVILLPLNLLFFSYHPKDRGLEAYGDSDLPSTGDLPAGEVLMKNPMVAEWSVGQLMRTYQLWFLVLSYFLYWGVGNYLVLAHQVKFIEDAGFSSMLGASVYALFGIMMCAGQLSGFISDWMGREKTATLAALLSVAGLLALLSVRDTSRHWPLYIFPICFGYGAGLYTPTVFAGSADIFHGKQFGVVAGLLLMGMGVGGAIGPWLGGYLYDISGSYTSAFVLSMGCNAVACISLWIAAPRNADRMRAGI